MCLIFKTQEMLDKILSDDPLKLKYCQAGYKTHKMCDEAVDNCLAAPKFVPDWFVTNKMMKKLLTALYADDNILDFNKHSCDAAFSCNKTGILSIGINWWH